MTAGRLIDHQSIGTQGPDQGKPAESRILLFGVGPLLAAAIRDLALFRRDEAGPAIVFPNHRIVAAAPERKLADSAPPQSRSVSSNVLSSRTSRNRSDVPRPPVGSADPAASPISTTSLPAIWLAQTSLLGKNPIGPAC